MSEHEQQKEETVEEAKVERGQCSETKTTIGGIKSFSGMKYFTTTFLEV